MKRTLNIVGCGRVGRTLGRLWAGRRTFEIGDLFDGTPANSAAAADFIGAGRAARNMAEMCGADAWMLTPPDDQIAICCEALAATGVLAAGNVVFHCSGALPSSDLAPAARRGAAVASVHPLKSFAEPASAAQTFAGTGCAAEGDARALAVLTPAFESIGGVVCAIDPGAKSTYHAASVIVCNYLVALLETGVRCYEKAGFARDDALQMMEPLVRETLDNVFRLGTVRALTGPVARGDHAVIARQLEALAGWEPRIAAIYRELGLAAVGLARQQAEVDAANLGEIERVLTGGK